MKPPVLIHQTNWVCSVCGRRLEQGTHCPEHKTDPIVGHPPLREVQKAVA